jgi:hypothetical protein
MAETRCVYECVHLGVRADSPPATEAEARERQTAFEEALRQAFPDAIVVSFDARDYPLTPDGFRQMLEAPLKGESDEDP